jgi:hypothetical protein
MPTIVVPEDIHISNPTNEQDPGFVASFCKWFIDRTILNDPEWGRTTAMLYTAMEIRGLVKDGKPGDEIKLSKDQYDRLRTRVETPTNPYIPITMMQCKAFLDAVLEPKEK